MTIRRSYRLEERDDDVLAVVKAEAGPEDVLPIAFIFLWSLLIAGLLITLPLTTKRPVPRERAILEVGVGLAILAVGATVVAVLYRRIRRGSWIIDSSGITYQPATGPCLRIEWAELERVRWHVSPVIFHGRDRIVLRRGDLDGSNWQLVRKRIESLLSGRFDLSMRSLPPVPAIGVRGVLALTVPPCVLAVLIVRYALPYPKMLPLVVAYIIVLAVPFAVSLPLWIIRREQQEQLLNPTWRKPKKETMWDDL